MHYFFLGARRKLVLGASRRVERARGPLVVSCLGVAEWAFAGARPAGLALSWFVLAAALRRGRAFWGASSALRSRGGFDASCAGRPRRGRALAGRSRDSWSAFAGERRGRSCFIAEIFCVTRRGFRAR